MNNLSWLLNQSMLVELHSLVSGRTNCTPYSCIPIPTWWDLVSLESAAGLQNSSACWLERAVVLRHCPQIWSLWPPQWAKTNKNKSSLCFDCFFECSRCKPIHRRWSLHLCFHCKPKKKGTHSRITMRKRAYLHVLLSDMEIWQALIGGTVDVLCDKETTA